MKIILSLVVAIVGVLTGGLIAVLCETEERKTVEYDNDNDGGFFDDWRLL